MEKKKGNLYVWMLTASIIYIIYATLTNLYFDAQASAFLSQKINLARPLYLPVWLTVMHVHVVVACLAMLTGAINFSTAILQKYRKYHRVNGYLYVLFVFLVCVTSGYMAPYSTGGRINSMAFNFLNIIWFAITVTAIVKIKRKKISQHRKWMVRSFVFCFTNLFIHLFTNVLQSGFGMKYELSYTIGIYGTIFFNFILAEIVIYYVYGKKRIENV
ncbi:DUF2306 domain-containing protein [Paenibacillus sp. N3.4]|uniref:DUF2306 domain-containing protein n=1 Tax=Paenibacillus sp. N3.4 TaxID=2603222 RepID=UPI0011CA3A52|nr:DUF2306 domain-containing protein [Paenibacillus sp. N3.4]TXK84861.1 DUF2306 domain-containing protein [Paenibacillus sp. N3.4]